MTRKNARELMMQILYQMDLNNDFSGETRDHYLQGKKTGEQAEYCQEIYDLSCEYKNRIDSLISQFSVKWKIERMPKTDIAILRVATAELLYIENIPTAVSINEAVELAKKYGTEQSPRFVNAILGNIEKEIRA